MDSRKGLRVFTLKSIPLEAGFQIDALLLLEAHNCHVLFLGRILDTDIVLVVLEAVFEGWALDDLALHHDVELCVLLLAFHDFDANPLAEDCKADYGEEE